MQGIKYIHGIFIVIALSLFSIRGALADVGPLPHFHSLIQQGQDVEIELAIPDDGYLLVEHPHTLIREQEGALKIVFQNKVLSSFQKEVSNSKGVCVHSYDYSEDVDCTETPEECRDCNGDGIPECYVKDYCDWYGLFKVVDDCVWPGEVTYNIQNEHMDYAERSETIEVQDFEYPCLNESDTDGDTSGDNDKTDSDASGDNDKTDSDASDDNGSTDSDASDDNGSDDGCSTSALGSKSVPGLTLVLFMFAVGLLASKLVSIHSCGTTRS